MSAAKTLSGLHANPGNATAYRSVFAKDTDGMVPRVDAVIVTAAMDWLRTDTLAVATITPREARKPAQELLAAADRIEERVLAER